MRIVRRHLSFSERYQSVQAMRIMSETLPQYRQFKMDAEKFPLPVIPLDLVLAASGGVVDRGAFIDYLETREGIDR